MTFHARGHARRNSRANLSYLGKLERDTVEKVAVNINVNLHGQQTASCRRWSHAEMTGDAIIICQIELFIVLEGTRRSNLSSRRQTRMAFQMYQMLYPPNRGNLGYVAVAADRNRETTVASADWVLARTPRSYKQIDSKSVPDGR